MNEFSAKTERPQFTDIFALFVLSVESSKICVVKALFHLIRIESVTGDAKYNDFWEAKDQQNP